MADLQIRCLVCEELFDQLEGSHPDAPVGGVVLVFDAKAVGVHLTRDTVALDLRAYLCDECVLVKAKNGLIRLVRTVVEHRYETWKPETS